METIKLGEHEVEVYPQRHAYITNKVGKVIAQVIADGGDINDAQDIVGFLGGGTYAMLAAMCPNYGKRCPEYEFMGFKDKESYERGDYDEKFDKSPDYPEQVAAFEVLARVNRFDVLKVVQHIIDPKMVKAAVAGWMADRMESTLSGGSVTELLPTDGSRMSTPFGTTPPTSTENGGSRGAASKLSSTPEPSAAS